MPGLMTYNVPFLYMYFKEHPLLSLIAPILKLPAVKIILPRIFLLIASLTSAQRCGIAIKFIKRNFHY